MKNLFKLSALALLATTTGAFALPVNVPEISAMDGTAALAVVAAAVALVWERRRRSA